MFLMDSLGVFVFDHGLFMCSSYGFSHGTVLVGLYMN